MDTLSQARLPLQRPFRTGCSCAYTSIQLNAMHDEAVNRSLTCVRLQICWKWATSAVPPFEGAANSVLLMTRLFSHCSLCSFKSRTIYLTDQCFKVVRIRSILTFLSMQLFMADQQLHTSLDQDIKYLSWSEVSIRNVYLGLLAGCSIWCAHTQSPNL